MGTTKKTEEMELPDDVRARLIAAGRRTEMLRMPELSGDDAAVVRDQLMRDLDRMAIERFDGHLTIMRFTTNWRIGFGTPEDRWDIQVMPVGRSFEEAARAALARPDEMTAQMGEHLRDQFFAELDARRPS